MHEFGNNKIIPDKVSSNLEYNEYTAEKEKKYITVKSDKTKRKFTFTFSKEFWSNVNNEWIMDWAELMDTCTTKIRDKVKQILGN